MKYNYNKAKRRRFINKKILALFLALIIICGLIVIGGYFIFHKNDNPLDAGSAVTTTVSSSSNDLASTGGLRVDTDPSAATNLGQLSTTTVGNSSSSTQSVGSSSVGSSTTNSPADPSTFAQYNKYASSTSALFGDINVGTGATLAVGQTAEISYKGWLTNGTLFAQSGTNSSGQTVALSFVLGQHQVLAGLEEGVDGMKVGGTRLIIVPPSVGYGSAGKNPVPPNAVLIFEVSLLDAK